MYNIQFSKNALMDLEYFRKFDHKIILAGIEQNLSHQPSSKTKNRKPLRPNELAKWELRIEQNRVFYDVLEVEQIVDVVAIGWKEHNKLFIRGEEVKL